MQKNVFPKTSSHFFNISNKNMTSLNIKNLKVKHFFVLAFTLFSLTAFAQNDNPIWPSVFSTPAGAYEEISEDFDNYWKDRSYEKGKGYKQFLRWKNYMTPRIYPSNDLTLPFNNYHNFIEWQRTQVASARGASSWSSLGPIGRPTGDDSGVGRLNIVRFDPTNTATMYVGAPDGGLWKSTNSGASWTTNTDFLGVIGVSDLAIDPNNTQIMYLATGDLEGDRRSIGVLKSTDGGANWVTTGLSWTASDNYKISKLLMHPSNSSILLAATDGGVFRSTDAGATWSSPSQIEDFKDMEFKPSDPNTVYAAGTEFWKSTDNGVSFTKITSGLPAGGIVARIALGVTTNDAAYVYAIIAQSSDRGLLGVYRSTDSGTSFTNQNANKNVLGYDASGTDMGGQGDYDLAITVSPLDKNKVSIGGVNQWQSTDGGTNWTLISHWDPTTVGVPFVHADIHELSYMPGNNTTIFSCGDGGIYKSTDDGATWTDISNNLSIAQQNAIGISASSASHLLAGLQDIGSIYTTGTWSVVGGGDGEDCFIDRTDNNYLVVSGTNGTHKLSTNGGTSFSNITTGLPTGDGNAEFFSPIRQDPNNNQIYYAGGRTPFYKSTNEGTSWTALGTPFAGSHIVEFMVAPSNTSIVYALKGNAIAKSTNGGTAWTNITGTLPTGSASLTNLTISNTDPNKVWVTFSGYSATHKVYKTIDGGTTWTNLSTGLPNLPVNTIVYQNGSTTEDVYIGMDIGVYHIDKNTTTWTAFFTNLPRVRVKNLRIFYVGNGKLRAATYGRGAWETDLAVVLPVELSSFKGKNEGNINHLHWTTATEINLGHYSIEHSSDGKTYEVIGTVEPEAANSTVEKNYTFTHTTPQKGINYYRLKIIDVSLEYEYSSSIVLFVEDTRTDIVLYPNPVINTMQLKGVDGEQVIVQFRDALGRAIRRETVSGNEPINVRTFPNGTYFIEIHQEGKQTVVRRFIKQ
jgi:photosystem II stability/assembly factor-like uncharacterized protein